MLKGAAHPQSNYPDTYSPGFLRDEYQKVGACGVATVGIRSDDRAGHPYPEAGKDSLRSQFATTKAGSLADTMSSHPYPVSELQGVTEGELMIAVILTAAGEGVIKIEERAFAQRPLSTKTEVSKIGRSLA